MVYFNRIYDSILSDHKAVTEPDYKTPFKSKQDVIDRLLPYHIYQYPKVDMDANKIPMDKQGMCIPTLDYILLFTLEYRSIDQGDIQEPSRTLQKVL